MVRLRAVISYDFALESGRHIRFDIDPDRSARAPSDDDPDWVALGFHQCDHCPLSEGPNCPAAADLREIVIAFADVSSTETALVRVETAARTYEKACDAQTGLGSLVGLVMATSGCPTLSRMRPMAYTHLPFSTIEETLFRTTSTYLLGEYLRAARGGEPDYAFDGLRALYTDLSALNNAFATRLRAAAEKDANLNAVVRLFSLSALVSMSVDCGLQLVAPWFEARK